MVQYGTSAQRRITKTGLSVFLVTLILLVWFLQWSESTRKIDRLVHDSWVRFYQRPVPEDVVIAAIDSVSLSELGRWPWSRNIQAQLFEQLNAHEANAVVADLLYVEAADQSEDERLANAIGALPISVLPVLTEGGGGRVATESLPIPAIVREVSDLGHIFLPIDDDGIVRRVFLESGFNQSHWPTLALAAVRAIQGGDDQELPGLVTVTEPKPGQWVENHEVLIPFYGKNASFERVSAVDIIRGDIPAKSLKDKIVFVGMTTSGLGDVVPTPVSALDQPIPGVEIHANVFSAIRDGSLVVFAHSSSNLLVALILLPLMLVCYSRAAPQWGFVTSVIGAALPILLSFLVYRFGRIWYAPLAASIPILISYLFWSWHRLAYINRYLEREQAKLAPHIPSRDNQSNQLLAEFFQTAQRHLPLEGWRFKSGKEQYSSNSAFPDVHPTGNETRWCKKEGIYTKMYPGIEPLHIQLMIEDPRHGKAITRYVDTLARVRSREKASRLAGSIEQLQTNALQLSEQLDWLCSVKVFSENILNGSPTGFGVWNAAGECVRANSLLYQMLPSLHAKAELVDFLTALNKPTRQSVNAERLQQLLFDSEPWQVTYSNDEQELVINFSAVGDVLATRLICASVLDVSDIRTAEKARAEMMEYLSHDLRSPLISALYLLEDKKNAQAEQNIQQSLSMMDDLLNIARADNLDETRFEAVFMNGVLDDSLEQMMPQARAKGIQFDIDTTGYELWVVGDVASLGRAVSNILGNAIKYSPEHTTVSIRLHREQQDAVVTIDDEGVGIAPEMLSKLFTRFKRDASTASDYKGIGLGLALVARVVSLHKGSVEAQNLEKGTRIVLKIPLEEEIQEE